MKELMKVFILDCKVLELKIVVKYNPGFTGCIITGYALFPDEKDKGWQNIGIMDIIENFECKTAEEFYYYMKDNAYSSYLDLSCFKLSDMELRNRIRVKNDEYLKIGYLSINEKNVSHIVNIYDIGDIKNIRFENREYEANYFEKNFLMLLCNIENVFMDGWIILNENYIYGIEDNKIKLKINNDFFYIDDLFLKFQKICFNNKRFFNDDYDKLFREVVDYLNEYNKNIKLEKIQPIINYGGNAKVTFTIDNYDRDFHFTEEPFEIEIPYDFDRFIKSHTIKKMLRNKIKKHYKAWDGNFYRFDIEYNGRKETLFL